MARYAIRKLDANRLRHACSYSSLNYLFTPAYTPDNGPTKGKLRPVSFLTTFVQDCSRLRKSTEIGKFPSITQGLNFSRNFSTSPIAGRGNNEGTETSSTAEDQSEAADERTQILEAAINHVNRLGWTEAALAEGAQELGFSPSIIGIFHRKDADLVEYYMDECRKQLELSMASRFKEFEGMSAKERVMAAIRERLELQALYVSSWPQVLSIQARPANVSASFRQRNELLEVLWKASGETGSNMESQIKKAGIAGLYTTTEVYMLTDFSPGFEDTWKFLERQLDGIGELKKSADQASFYAQALGAGLSNAANGIFKGHDPSKF